MRRKTIHSLSCLAAGLLLVLAGCGEPEATAGSARFFVSLHPSLSSQDITRVTVTLAASDLSTRSENLALVDGQWTGILAHIPSGSQRTFSAEAFDASGSKRFAGQVSGVTISPRQTAAVALVLQEVGGAPSLDNSMPGVQALLASRALVRPGGTLSFEVLAHDPDPADSLSYSWTATAGAFSSPSSTSTSWTAPQTEGPVTVTVTVTDSQGASDSHSLTVDVGTFPPAVVATSQQPLQSWGGLYLYVAAWDPQDSELTFSWATHQGTLGSPQNSRTASETSWSAPDCLPEGVVPVVTVTVLNTLGLSTTKTFTISDPIPTCPPSGQP